jgi:hypothetical protein
MNRREAINRVAWIMGGTVIGANLLLEGCTRPATPTVEGLFDPAMVDFIGDVADTILPETSSPGAKAAGVGGFIPVMVKDCYTAEDQDVFVKGADRRAGARRAREEISRTDRRGAYGLDQHDR